MKANHRAMIGLWVCLFCIGAAVVLCAPSAWAQQTAGSITGTVTDASGAAIPNATVTARDVNRSTTWTTKTDSAGVYDFPQVTVGDIEVKVEATGFSIQVHPAFNLILNQVARIDFQMKVGEVSQIVEVNEAPPLLQTDSPQVSTLFSANMAETLPLSTHNINQLTLLAPGVVTPNLFGFQAAQNTFGTGRPYVNGAREQENNFILDGMDDNQPDNNDVGYVPAPDAVAEFNLITSNAPADFGNYLGGIINESIKSGTNAFHGDVYEYLRNSDLNANSWSNNANGIARPGLQYNDFGATLGGPIIKNKLFFFADFEGSRFNQPSSIHLLSTIPAAELGGDFSALCAQNVPNGSTAAFNNGGMCVFTSGPNTGAVNTAGQLYDPNSSANPATRTPFLNNFINPNTFDAAASAIINSPFWPLANPSADVTHFTTNAWQGDLKMDFQPTQDDHIMGRWSQQAVEQLTTNSIQLLGDSDRTFPLDNFVLDWAHTISSSLVNDARVGFAYFPVTEGFTNPTGTNLPSTFGIAGVNVSFLPQLTFEGSGPLPGVIGNADLIETFHDTTEQIEDTLTWTHEKHNVTTGFEFYHYIMNDIFPGDAGLAGQFLFNGQFTGNTGTTNGNAVADFLLGLPEDVQEGNGGGGTKYLRNNLFGAFVQDNWRFRSNLTLNLGLRYELTTARHTDNGQDVNFNLITGQPVIGFGYHTYNGIGNWQPRLGFAWQPSQLHNTVIRGGYGISTFMEANGVNNLPYQNPPFVEAHEAIYSGLALPTTNLDQGFSGFPAAACDQAALLALSPACISGATLHLTNPYLRPALDQQWNLSIQKQLGNSTTFTVGYLGNHINHMSDIFIFNQNQLVNGVVQPGPFAQPLIHCVGCASAPTIRYNDSSGIERYEALQVSGTERLAHGLEFDANYTWSKCLSNGLGYFGQFGDEEALPGSVSQTNSSFFFQNAYDPNGDYGRCISDIASDFNGFVTYDLPFGHGRQFASGVNKVENEVIGGWNVAADFTFHSGFAINPSVPDQSGTGSVGATRPNCGFPGISQHGNMQPETINGVNGFQFLNPLAVSTPLVGTFGNCGEGSFRGPGLDTIDLNIAKQFVVTERTNLQFMAQFINLFNTPIFGAPNATLGPTFGFISSSNPGRQIQFGLRFSF